MEDPAGNTIGRFQVAGELGRGAMGTVYEAHDPVLDRRVAVKTMFPGLRLETEMRSRFLREARAAARLQHPNIVTVFDLGEEGEVPFIAMELLEGRSLEAAIDEGGVQGVRSALEVVAQICRGLAYAHDRGVIHRDVKPSNVWLLPDGGVKLVDFGIAWLEDAARCTRTGQAMGTPAYMAPEHFTEDAVDARADQWSVGVLLYELLTGTLPFAGSTLPSLVYRIVHEHYPPVEEDLEIPERLLDLLSRMLAKRPDERLGSMAEVASELAVAAAAGDAPAAEVPEVLEQLRLAREYLEMGEESHALRVAKRTRERNPSSALARTWVLRLESAGHDLAEPPPPRDSKVDTVVDLPTRSQRQGGPRSDLAAARYRERDVLTEGAPLQCLAVAPGEEVLAVGRTDGSVRLWDLTDRLPRSLLRNRLHERTGHASMVTRLAFSNDGRWMVVGHLDGTLTLWELPEGIEQVVQPRHDGPVRGAVFVHADSVLASGGGDATLKLWEANGFREGEARRMLRRQPAPVSGVVALQDDASVALGCENRSIRVVDVASGRLRNTLFGLAAAPSSLLLLTDGRLAAGERSGSIALFDPGGRGITHRLDGGHGRSVTDLCCLAGDTSLLSTDRGPTALLWDMESGTPRQRLGGAAGESAAAVAVTGDGASILVGLADGRVRVYEPC